MSLEDRESRGRSNEGIEGRDRDDGASNRGMAGAPRSCKWQGTESPPELLEGEFPAPPRHLEFGLPASGKCERIHLCVLSHQGDGICYSSQRKKLVQSLCGLGHEMTVRANLGHLFPCFLPSDGERSISLLFVKLGSGHVLILEPTKAPQGKGRR